MGSRGNIVGAAWAGKNFRNRWSRRSGARERPTRPVVWWRNGAAGGKVAGASGPGEHRWQRGGAADVVRPPVGTGDVRIVAAVLLSLVTHSLKSKAINLKSAIWKSKKGFTNLIPGELQLKLKVHLQVS